MPHFGKSTVSRFLRTHCQRQLRLSLAPKDSAERARQGMPDPQPPRWALLQAGNEWEQAKICDLEEALGPGSLRGNRVRDGEGRARFDAIGINDPGMLGAARPGEFLVQARFGVPADGPFAVAFGIDALRARFGLSVGEAIPDLIMVVAPGAAALDGGAPLMALPDGSCAPVPDGDRRCGLRVIDIKLTAESNPGYFAEVAYYAIALAGWLEGCRGSQDPQARGLADRFHVLADAAVWPGKHEGSEISRLLRRGRAGGLAPGRDAVAAAFAAELEPVAFDVFAQRLRTFFANDMPGALAADWRDLPWHVDARCHGCAYLGNAGRDRDHPALPGHCMPMAADGGGHLSRVPFLSRGARQALEARGVRTVAQLAVLPADDPAFSQHQALRTGRTIIRRRAAVLAGIEDAHAAPDAGTSAVMPKFAHLKLFLTAPFDPGSQMTLAFGLAATWIEARAFEPGTARPWDEAERQRWEHRTFLVDMLDLDAERREFLAFMEAVNGILRDQQIRESDLRNGAESTYQAYVWDHAAAEHLRRVVGRHLAAVQGRTDIRNLAGLFPSADMLADPGSASRRSPLTVVQDVVRAVLAVPVPHHYSLLNVARAYHPANTPADRAEFRVSPLFDDGFSDAIPAERAHEIWTRSARPPWVRRAAELDRTLGRHSAALEAVTRRLGTDLHATLNGQAPRIPRDRRRDAALGALNPDSRLWSGFIALNSAASRMEVDTIRAMPPHEREARFKSARLEERLEGQDEAAALAALRLEPRPGRRVYRLSPASAEVSLREGDFDWALCPEDRPGLLDRKASDVTGGAVKLDRRLRRMEDVLAVSVAAVDRTRRLICLDPNRVQPEVLDEIEAHGILDLSRGLTMDPVHIDSFQAKLDAVLAAIGTPREAFDNPLAGGGETPAEPPAGPDRSVPAAEVLWNAHAMSQAAGSPPVGPLLKRIGECGISLNPSQAEALRNCLSRRLHLIWGPPGTGKSETLAAVLLASLLDAQMQGRRLRILVTAFTWTAIDNVLAKLAAKAGEGSLAGGVRFHRVRSAAYPVDLPAALAGMDTPLEWWAPSEDVDRLKRSLTSPLPAGQQGLYVVGATSQQVFNMVRAGGPKGRATEDLFDLVVIDEGSQMGCSGKQGFELADHQALLRAVRRDDADPF